MKRKYILVLATAPVFVFIDQLTKWLIVENMSRGQSIPIIDNFLSLHFLVNPGGAFGLFYGISDTWRAPFFLLVSLAAMGVVVFYLAQAEDKKIFFPLCLSMVLSGAIGNLTDRIRMGHVVDFILVEATFLGNWMVGKLDRSWGTHYWPSFNVADTVIVIGIIGMAIDLLFFTPVEEDSAPEKTDSPAGD